MSALDHDGGAVERSEHKRLPEPETMMVEVSDENTAKSRAASLWNVSTDDLICETVEESRGFLGLIGRKLRVKISTTKPLMHLHARDFLQQLIDGCGLSVSASLRDDCSISLEGDDSAIMIGRHGETLKAFEFLTNLMFRPDQELPKIRFDCGGYKDRREESLVRLAKSTAREATRRGCVVHLEPMSSWERRIIHMTLQDSRTVTTSSEGQEPMRHVAVIPNVRGERRHRPSRRSY